MPEVSGVYSSPCTDCRTVDSSNERLWTIDHCVDKFARISIFSEMAILKI